jgi:hypothetical protein
MFAKLAVLELLAGGSVDADVEVPGAVVVG